MSRLAPRRKVPVVCAVDDAGERFPGTLLLKIETIGSEQSPRRFYENIRFGLSVEPAIASRGVEFGIRIDIFADTATLRLLSLPPVLISDRPAAGAGRQHIMDIPRNRKTRITLITSEPNFMSPYSAPLRLVRDA